jgi:pimeloyl-ACP methyl ester carboxylesterase
MLLATACSASTGSTGSRAVNDSGTIGGAQYKLQVPPNWNGTLFLYSHGFVGPSEPNLAMDAPGAGDAIGAWLLRQGYAIAGSSYSSKGWSVEEALVDQMALLDFFQKRVAAPRRVIAWGDSMGGLITAALAQLHPDRFAGAIPMCGVLSGSIGFFNTLLDGAYAFRTLLAPVSDLRMVHIPRSAANLDAADKIFQHALATPEGVARIALAGALADLPGWYQPNRPEATAADLAGWSAAEQQWFSQILLPAAFDRSELELRAGGNPSWNTGVDYRYQLSVSADRDQVVALYSAAGLDLNADLATLNSGPRIEADPQAVTSLEADQTFDGRLSIPVLTLHTTGDGEVIPETETAYGDVVRAAGKQDLLRQVYVHRAGHCTFTPGETIAIVQSMLDRLNNGMWDDQALQPQALNNRAHSVGASYQAYGGGFAGPAFVAFNPGPFPRPFPKSTAPVA